MIFWDSKLESQLSTHLLKSEMVSPGSLVQDIPTVRSLAVSPGEKLVAAGTKSGELLLFDRNANSLRIVNQVNFLKSFL